MKISISPSRAGRRVSDKLYGIFLEDINYGCDGGLYAELVPNRAFENVGPGGEDCRLMRWTALGGTRLEIRSERPRGEKNPHYLRMSGGERPSVRNDGYLAQGLWAAPGEGFRLTLLARADAPCTLSACLASADGAVLARAETALDTDFCRYELLLTTQAPAQRAYLTLTSEGGTPVEMDFVSLFPMDTFMGRENGCRADLAQALAALQPSFLRFPGGCIVEGRSFDSMYRFRETLGPVEERRTNWNRWQLAEYQKDGNSSEDYFQSYGMGFFEFFRLCEDIGARPLPILNCGLTCQWHEGLAVPMAQMGDVIQDYLDLVEFCRGGVDTPMGRIRTEMGHPAPFALEMIGVGNEQWNEVYFERYEVIHRAVKAQHPDIELIGCAGWTDHGEEFDAAMAWMRKTAEKPDYSDEHYYKGVDWFYRQVNRYAAYDPNLPRAFAGEYAAHEKDGRNTLRAALAEAAFLTGVENASPNVAMACYAPLLARVGGHQWKPDLIWFDQERCYPTVNYYVQQLFSCHQGSVLADVTVSGADPDAPVYLTASWRDEDGALLIKAVNPHTHPQALLLQLPQPFAAATAHVLHGADPDADNAPGAAPIEPVSRDLPPDADAVVLPPFSVTVLVFLP